jgi:hypothetical protein
LVHVNFWTPAAVAMGDFTGTGSWATGVPFNSVPLLRVASVQSTSTDQTWVGTLILHHPCTKITNLAGIAFFAWHICTDTGTSLAAQDSHDATMWPSHGWNPTVDSKQTHQGLHHGIQKMSGTKEPVQTDPSPQTHHGWHRGVHKVHDVGNTTRDCVQPTWTLHCKCNHATWFYILSYIVSLFQLHLPYGLMATIPTTYWLIDMQYV